MTRDVKIVVSYGNELHYYNTRKLKVKYLNYRITYSSRPPQTKGQTVQRSNRVGTTLKSQYST